MDPRELANQLSVKIRTADTAQAALDAEEVARQRLRADQQKQAQAALQSVVIPYLEELQKEIGTAFVFEVIRDESTVKPIGVTFSLHSIKVAIISRFGHLSTAVLGMKELSPFDTSVVSPTDLTRVTIGKLIEELTTMA